MSTANSDAGSLPCHESSPDTTKTPLWMSLYVQSVTAPAVNEHTLTSVPSVNNPCPLRVMGDNSEFWVNDTREPLTFMFPETLDLEGQFVLYFNLLHTGCKQHPEDRYDDDDDDDDVADTTLQVVFFDDKEAFKDWADTDYVWGTRVYFHLDILQTNAWLFDAMISAETWLKDASALDAAEPYTNFSSFFLP
ncbi:hypothetical protein BD769DRAFT_1385671 [Suillus cothurnatus]|nr:hypothetical protein BD769DRAFT_1385671 [Suillus cothurnatus]